MKSHLQWLHPAKFDHGNPGGAGRVMMEHLCAQRWVLAISRGKCSWRGPALSDPRAPQDAGALACPPFSPLGLLLLFR